MIVLAVQMLRLATAVLPLLFSAKCVLPSMPVERLAYRASAAAGSVLSLVASIDHAGIHDVNTGTGASGSGDSRPVAGAGLAPPASGSTGSSSSSQSKGGKSGASGATGGSGEATSGAGESAPGEDSDPDRDDDQDRDSEDSGSVQDPGTMRRSSTPDVSFGLNPVHVPAGEYHRDNIVCIGGDVTIDGEVRGDIVVVGGVLTISGRVRGEVVAVASKVHLHDTAFIRGDFVSVSGPVERSANAHIGGQYHSIDLPNLGRFATGHGVFLYLLYLFLWVGVIVTAFRFMAVLVVAAIAPGRVEGALAAPRVSWIFAFFLGFIVHLFAGVVGFLLIVGIVTSPIGFALWLGVRVVVWMGLAAIYLEIGRNISKTAFGNRLSYFGSILLGFSIFAVVGLIPFIGWFVTGIMSSTALGLMLLTRFGNRGRLAPGVAGFTAVGPAAAATPIAATAPSPESSR
jgi:hypothetical protein